MRPAVLALAAVVSLGPSPDAQSTIDFSGTWVASDAAPPAVPRAPAPAFGERFAMRHRADNLTVVRPSRATPVVTPFVLDGREIRVRIPGSLCLGDAETTTAKTSATIAEVGWIAGHWSGGEKTTTVEERWTPPSGGSMLAVARTMRDGVMGSFEFLCIVERGGTLVYQAMPGGRSPATDFTATSVTADAVTFENPAHDYPKMIRYARLPDGSLQTTISAGNGQRERSFVLKRQD